MPERLSRPEFVAMMAMLFATIAFSIDAMLPALPRIAQELTPEAPNRAQLILTSFVLGMGLGTLFTGPLSDACGRKPVIIWGSLLYIAGAALAWAASSLELMLAARLLQGLGAAAPRIVALAIVRDLYDGRRMAQLMSFVMMIFTVVPAAAPSVGAVIIDAAGWRNIFGAFALFSAISVLWLWLRQSETLPPRNRRPFRLPVLRAGVVEVLANRQVAAIIVVLTLAFGILFAVLSSIQPLFDVTFGRAESFPLWFAAIAAIAATGSLLNAQVVMRMGMRRVAAQAFLAQTILSAGMLALTAASPWDTTWGFAVYVFWTASVFFMTGLTVGNLNALAMVPMGHIAGTAASVIGAVSTVLAVFIAAPIGLAFDGTPAPIAAGVLVCSVICWAVTRSLGDAASEPEPGRF